MLDRAKPGSTTGGSCPSQLTKPSCSTEGCQASLFTLPIAIDISSPTPLCLPPLHPTLTSVAQAWAAALLLAALCFTPQGCGQQGGLTGGQGASLIRSSDSSNGSGSGRSDSSSTTGDFAASAGGGSRSRGRSAAAAAATDQHDKVCVVAITFDS